MTLRTRITLLTLALLTFSLLLIGASVYGTLRGTLYNNLRNDLQDASVSAARLIKDKGSLSDLPSTVYGKALLPLLTNPNPTLSDIKSSLVPLSSSPSLGGQTLEISDNAFLELLRSGGVYTSSRLVQNDGKIIPVRLRAQIVETEISGETASVIGLKPGLYQIILYVGRSTEQTDTLLHDFAQIYTATALLMLLFGGFLAYQLVRRTLEPLEWVARKAEQVSDKFEELPQVEGNNEVASLVRSLNRMLHRLENAWETQTRFLLDASHELRTPVTAILGHVGYLMRRTQLTPQQRESLEVVARESERMRKLVGDLLELSQTGGWKVELGPVHLSTVLYEIQEEYGRSFEGSLEVEAPDNLWALGDPERLHQVVANFVSNAIKAGSTQIRLVARDLSERVVVRVEDNGEGIPAEHLPHLFERFYRVDKARDRERGGSGLGLAIVRSIVEAHGGSVWVESEPGKGSVFSVSLKRAATPQPELAG